MAPLHFVVGCVCCVRRGDSSGVSCQDSFLSVESFLREEGGESLISGPSGMPGREGQAHSDRASLHLLAAPAAQNRPGIPGWGPQAQGWGVGAVQVYCSNDPLGDDGQ